MRNGVRKRGGGGSKEATWVPVPRPHDTRAEHAGGGNTTNLEPAFFVSREKEGKGMCGEEAK